MGWLDKLLGRDKEEAGEPAAASTTMEESGHEDAGMAEDQGSHEGHDHAPGEPHDHSHDESA
jgi:hypothetical protein